MSRNIFLARHGHREDFIGDTEQYNHEWAKDSLHRLDPALSTLGRSQAQNLANRLKKEEIQHIFSSPFLRTIETASYISEQTGIKIKVESGLSEWLNPDWFPSGVQLNTNQDLTLQFPSQINTSYSSLVSAEYPEPNEHLNVWPRTAKTLKLLLENYEGNLLIIGHAASIIGVAFALAGRVIHISTELCGLIHFREAGENWQLLLDGSNNNLFRPMSS